MDTSLDDPPLAAELILEVIKNALVGCKHSSNRGLLGFVRGIEIGISELQGTRATGCDALAPLRKRWFRLSQSRNTYQLGVALGIDVAIDIASVNALRRRH
jgi:hypothetical protein